MRHQADGDRVRKRRNAAAAKLFSGKGNEEDARITLETIVDICRINEGNHRSGIDYVIEAVARDAKRQVYLDLIETITVGRREAAELTHRTIADSEDGKHGGGE